MMLPAMVERLDDILDAPDATARLRGLILDLAIRGRLVAQNAADEPAADLLRRIAERLSHQANVVQRRRTQSAPFLFQPPFPLPARWEWTQIASLGQLNPKVGALDDLPASFVSMSAIKSELRSPHEHERRPWGAIRKGYTHFADGDVGLAKITPCFENGKSTVFRNLSNGIGSGTTELHVVRPFLVSADYMLLVLKSPHFIQTGIGRMTGTAGQKRIPSDYFAYSPFPLPPLAEQQRIVARVDELMDLCDQLEATQARRNALRDQFTSASLTQLTERADPGAPTQSDSVLANLEILTSTTPPLGPLRRAVLDLAVGGRLGLRSSHLGKGSTVATRDAEECADWTTKPLGDIAIVRNGRAYKKNELLDKGTPVLRVGNLFTSDKWYYSDLALESTKYCDAGDLLYAWSASFGPFIWQGPRAIFHYHIWRIDVINPDELSRDYMYFFLLQATNAIKQQSHGVSMAHMTKQKMERIEVPIPPLAEQQRIVAHVVGLMSLYDQLERRLAAATETRLRLLDALIADALALSHV